MATHIRAQVGWQVGSALPRDVMQITPCFRHQLDLTEFQIDWQTLADDLSAAINAWTAGAVGSTRQLTVKLYEIGKPKPNRPKAIKVTNVGQAAESPHPREIATCLSFNGGVNAPRQRGRLYIPQALIQGSTQVPVRPTTTQRDKVGELVPIFAGLGGANVDWIVWSPTNQSATKVERWFVDDEFDTVRKRGLRPTARTAGTTSG